jgi:hypothetical protein
MVVALDCASLFYLNANIPVLSNLLKNFSKLSFIYPPINAKFGNLDFDRISCDWYKSQEKKDLNVATEIVAPMILGLLMIFSSLIWQNEAGNASFQKYFRMNLYQVIYAVLSFRSRYSSNGSGQYFKIDAAENGKRPMEC